MLQIKVNDAVKHSNGWIYDAKTGIYGTDYLNRALVTAIGLGANRVQATQNTAPRRRVDWKTDFGSTPEWGSVTYSLLKAQLPFRQQERAFMTPVTVSLAEAAERIGTDRQTLRAVCNRLGFRDRQSDGQRVIPAGVVQLFA